MTDANSVLETQVSQELIEMRGCLSRTEWELVYLAASQFAQSHGLSIACFDLKSAELGDQARVADAEPAAAAVSSSQASTNGAG
jgi:hypothetical protein